MFNGVIAKECEITHIDVALNAEGRFVFGSCGRCRNLTELVENVLGTVRDLNTRDVQRLKTVVDNQIPDKQNRKEVVNIQLLD